MTLVCKKCGATAHSKCAKQRNVFPDDQDIALLKHLIAVDVNDRNCLIVDYTLSSDIEPTAYEGLKALKDILNHLTDEQLKRLACYCDWQQAPGTRCLFGCCVGEPV